MTGNTFVDCGGLLEVGHAAERWCCADARYAEARTVGTVFIVESVCCSSSAILSRSDRVAFSTKHSGYSIAMQVYGSRQPGSAALSWIAGSTPFERRIRAERAKPRRDRRYPGPDEASRLETLPCELIDTFDPEAIRDSIVWLRDWLLTHEDRYVEGLWMDHRSRAGRPFDRRECAEQVFLDFAPVFEFAGRSIERGERVLCTVST